MKKILTAFMIFFGSTSNATVIDFQDLTSGDCAPKTSNTLTSGAYSFTGNPSDSNLFLCNAGAVAANTSAALLNANSKSIINMTATDSSTFSLLSFYAGSRTMYMNPTTVNEDMGSTGIEIIGMLSNGGTILQTIVFDNLKWDQFTLSNSFVNLASVKFTALGSSTKPEFLIDDIVVNEFASVPEPSTLAIFALGMIGLASRRFKK